MAGVMLQVVYAYYIVPSYRTNNTACSRNTRVWGVLNHTRHQSSLLDAGGSTAAPVPPAASSRRSMAM